LLYKRNYLVSPSFWPDQIGPSVDSFKQKLGIIRQAKEIAFFGNTVERPFVHETIRNVTAFGNVVFVFGLERRTRSAEPAFVMPLVNVRIPFRRRAFRDRAPELLRSLVMKRLGRTHKNVVAAVFRVEPK